MRISFVSFTDGSTRGRALVIWSRPCPKRGKDSPEHRYRFEHLRLIGWARPRQVLKILHWCGHSQDFVAWPETDGYWRLQAVLGKAT